MVELKTVKDLELWKAPNINRELSVEVYRLKQEAIKDIKAIRDTVEDYYQLPSESMYKIGFYYQEEKIAVIEYIKWKFNITEKDLEDD